MILLSFFAGCCIYRTGQPIDWNDNQNTAILINIVDVSGLIIGHSMIFHAILMSYLKRFKWEKLLNDTVSVEKRIEGILKNKYDSAFSNILLFAPVVMVGPIMFVFGCDAMDKETKKLITKCRKCGEKFCAYPDLGLEIEGLAFKMSTLKRGFMASGFFPIRRSLLLSIVGTVASYFLTFEQFWRKSHNK
ncbi:hypothetical protein GWI33_013505 [Rhynchophorus ferrugineus]|uniref:Uncharacterized protein n=1 Tax=Rhynchophorus ferrugineus TaxID=354439 RepID=A0A834I6D2_RHYFE|nr:hypothetical protein GWI33_013505 [Rhynchophorus ferrugineus]